jgi:hypothetical protein
MHAEIHIERGRIRAVLPHADGVVIRTEHHTHSYPGAVVFPGFCDAHMHVLGLGRRLTSVSLHDASSAEECCDRLRTATSTVGGWIIGMGWDQELWRDSSYPSSDLLDARVPDVPVIASRVDGHVLWLNAAARAAVRATGIALPDHAVFIDLFIPEIWSAVPQLTDAEITTMIAAAGAECVRNGITEVHDMDVPAFVLEPMRAMAEAGTLPMRVQSFVTAQNNEWDTWGLLPAGGELLRIAGVKLYADGALGSRGAWMLEPYHDDPSTSGIPLLNAEQITERVLRAAEAGWTSVAIHAIGDAAVREVLNAYEVVRESYDVDYLILRIEHAQHVHPDDVGRFAALDVIAVMQPTMCLSDARMAERRLGTERLPWAYRWRSLLDAGTMIAASSDAPIEAPSPLAALDALTRRTLAMENNAWQGQERVDMHEAIEMYGMPAQTAAEQDYRRGELAIGYDADLVVLAADPESIPVTANKVLATYVAGQRRYGADHAS